MIDSSLFLAVLLVATVAVSPSGAAASITFGQPVVAIPYPGTTTGSGKPEPQSEPQMLSAKDGRILVAAQFEMWDCRTRRPLATTGVTYQDFGTDEHRACVWVSGESGRTFHIIGGDCCQNGDDVSLAQTPVSGTLLEAYMSNIGTGVGAPGLSLSRSTDNGVTWTHQVDADKQVCAGSAVHRRRIREEPAHLVHDGPGQHLRRPLERPGTNVGSRATRDAAPAGSRVESQR